MIETPRLGLPLLESGQAQKHVTVNEALARIDGLSSASALSRSLASPPGSPVEGALYLPPAGAAGDWAGRDGALALFSNGGWIFRAPEPGRRLWIADEGRECVFDGIGWSEGEGSSGHGAATETRVLVLDHPLGAETVSLTEAIIPDKAIVLGVTGRVLADIEGAGAWRLGVEGAADRYGSGLGVAAGSHALGVTGQPVAYYGATRLRLEAEGGAFAGGLVRLAAHCLVLTPPRWP